MLIWLCDTHGVNRSIRTRQNSCKTNAKVFIVNTFPFALRTLSESYAWSSADDRVGRGSSKDYFVTLLVFLSEPAFYSWNKKKRGYCNRKINIKSFGQGMWSWVPGTISDKCRTWLGSGLRRMECDSHQEVMFSRRWCNHMLHSVRMTVIGCRRRLISSNSREKNNSGMRSKRRQALFRKQGTITSSDDHQSRKGKWIS